MELPQGNVYSNPIKMVCSILFKKRNHMKNRNQFFKSGVLVLGFASAFALLTMALPSCNNATTNDTKEVAEEHNDAKFANAKEDDADFLVNAEEINLEEIELGRLAQTKGTSTQVKELGKLMEKEHSKASTDLQALAAKKQITIPTTLTDDGISANKKLTDTKTADFDKEYVDMMVSGHKDAISKFEKASNDAADAEIRNWAGSMLPIFRQHLDAFITQQKQLEKK